MLSVPSDNNSGRCAVRMRMRVAPIPVRLTDRRSAELLEERVSPFIEDIKRRFELGLGGDALEICKGVVLGLYRVRNDKGTIYACGRITIVTKRSQESQRRLDNTFKDGVLRNQVA